MSDRDNFDERFLPRVNPTPKISNVPPEVLVNKRKGINIEAQGKISQEEANLISNSLKSSFDIDKVEAFNEVKVFL
jgi:hypothetical protein